jgi:hypothetical protein
MTPSLVILAALGLPGAPAPKPPPPYFVTQRGARLVYQELGAEKTVVVSAVEEKDGSTVVTLERVDPSGQTQPDQKMVVSAKGLFRTELADWKFDARFACSSCRTSPATSGSPTRSTRPGPPGRRRSPCERADLRPSGSTW